MGLAKTDTPSLKNLPDRLSRPAALLSSKSLRSFYTVSLYTKLNLNLESETLGVFRIIVELKVNQISKKGEAN